MIIRPLLIGYSLVTHCRDRNVFAFSPYDPVRSLDTLIVIHILSHVSLHTVLTGQSSVVNVWPPTLSTAPLSFSYAMLMHVSTSTLILLIFVRGSFRPRTRLSLLAVCLFISPSVSLYQPVCLCTSPTCPSPSVTLSCCYFSLTKPYIP